MHADEITAVALIKIFIDKDIEIDRLPHKSDPKILKEYNFVIDIGRKYDGKRYFDHHQYKGGKSSAGLIWEYIGKESEYPKITKLIEKVDRHDVGIEKAKDFEYSNLLRCFNVKDYLGKMQDEAFLEAVNFSYRVLKYIKKSEDSAKEAESIVKNSYIFEGMPNVLELEKFNPFWNIYINSKEMPFIDVVVWESKEDNSYKAKVAPKDAGSFELNAKPFKADTLASFVHSTGYFALFENRDKLKKYLYKYYRR